jgi:hypothetical protein
MRFEVCRGNVKLGFLTFLDGFSKPPFTQEKGGVFDLDEIWDGEERAHLSASPKPPARSICHPSRPACQRRGRSRSYSFRAHIQAGEDREWFGAFLNTLLGEGYEVRQSRSQIPS